jgi:hypothetical protein
MNASLESRSLLSEASIILLEFKTYCIMPPAIFAYKPDGLIVIIALVTLLVIESESDTITLIL